MGWAGIPFRASLRTYLLLLIVGGMLPFLVISGALLAQVIRDNQVSVERRLLETARTQAATLDREMLATVRALEAIAGSAAIGADDLNQFEAEVRRVVPTQPSWFGVTLLTPDGQVLINTTRASGDPLCTAIDPESLDAVVRSGRPIIGNLRRGFEGRLMFAVRVPIPRDGQVRYVLSTFLTPESVAGIVAREFTDGD